MSFFVLDRIFGSGVKYRNCGALVPLGLASPDLLPAYRDSYGSIAHDTIANPDFHIVLNPSIILQSHGQDYRKQSYVDYPLLASLEGQASCFV